MNVPLELEKIPSDHRLSVSGGVLNISNVRREDSGYYTISATNAEGTTQTKIKIDVLYAPRYVSLLYFDLFLAVTVLDYILNNLLVVHLSHTLASTVYFVCVAKIVSVHSAVKILKILVPSQNIFLYVQFFHILIIYNYTTNTYILFNMNMSKPDFSTHLI